MPLSTVLPLLPTPLRKEMGEVLSSPFLRCARVSEVRLRCGRIASLSLYRTGKLVNLPLSYLADEEALKETLARAVGGSAYAFEEKLKEGFLTLKKGVRVGVSGKAAVACGSLSLLSLDALVFRMPSGNASADALFSFFKESTGGILLFSPPGGGKTTLLRALAACAAKEMRVAVVDTREEFFFTETALLLDHLSGYPKAQGAEIAVRTLSPELLILDEVGVTEARELSSLVSFGVRTVASVHGECASSVCAAPALAPLLHSGLFSHLWDVVHGCPFPIGGNP